MERQPRQSEGVHMSELPRQRMSRILQGADEVERAAFIEGLQSETGAGEALELLSDWGLRPLLREEEQQKVVEALSRTSNSVIATLSYGGQYELFSGEQRERLVQTIIDSNDWLSAQNVLKSGREIPVDLRDAVLRVSEEGEALTTSKEWMR